MYQYSYSLLLLFLIIILHDFVIACHWHWQNNKIPTIKNINESQYEVRNEPHFI